METNIFLNAYRLSITSDENVFSILTLLQRDGSKSELEISEATGINISEVRNKIRRLFQANLIKSNPDDTFCLTEFSQVLLSGFGVTEIAAKSLVSSTSNDLEEWEETFLKACIEAKSNLEEVRSIRYLNLLKSLILVERGTQKDLEEQSSRLLFVVIVGLDPDSQRLSGTEFCNDVYQWHSSKISDIWRTQRTTLDKFRSRLTFSCQRALEDTAESDRLLSYLADHQDKSQDKPQDRLSKLVVLVRLISAAIYSDPDPGLSFAFSRNKDLPYQIFALFEEWKDSANLQSDNSAFQKGFDKTAWLTLRNISANDFSDKIRQALVQKLSEDPKYQFALKALVSSTLSDYSGSELPLQEQQGQLTATFEYINKLKEHILSEDFNSLSLSCKQEVYRQVSEITEFIKESLSDS